MRWISVGKNGINIVLYGVFLLFTIKIMITKKIKLKNKRVEIGRRKSDNSVFIQFSRLQEADDDTKKTSETEYFGKKVETKLLISQAAAVSLYYLLRSELSISDLRDFEKETGQKLLAD